MPENKHMNWAKSFGTEAEQNPQTEDTKLDSKEPAANDADGWQQYRRWISKAPTPRTRRSGVDPSLYSWKGYRDWSDNVKRNWTRDHQDDE